MWIPYNKSWINLDQVQEISPIGENNNVVFTLHFAGGKVKIIDSQTADIVFRHIEAVIKKSIFQKSKTRKKE